ncbi:AEC family transporter, partial [Mediterraneibacter gnavus]
NTPLSMMLVGMMLAEMNPKGILDGTMVLYTIVRLILIPAILFGLTALLPIPALLRGITVIIAGMPAPVTTALLSAKYHGNEGYATGMIFVTTILSLFTLPIWCWLLE